MGEHNVTLDRPDSLSSLGGVHPIDHVVQKLVVSHQQRVRHGLVEVGGVVDPDPGTTALAVVAHERGGVGGEVVIPLRHVVVGADAPSPIVRSLNVVHHRQHAGVRATIRVGFRARVRVRVAYSVAVAMGRRRRRRRRRCGVAVTPTVAVTLTLERDPTVQHSTL